MPLIEINPPSLEPVSLAEVKDSARIDDSSFDAQIAILISALRRQAETKTGRALITQTVELVLDAFPVDDIDLLLANVQSIVSVKYIDDTGTENTLSNTMYTLDSASTPSWLMPAAGTTWPATRQTGNAVRIRFLVGYGDDSASVPHDIKLWIIAHAVQLLRNPDGLLDQSLSVMPFIDSLLDPYRVWRPL